MSPPLPVFLIDDDRVARMLFAHAFEEHGFPIVSFGCAEEFLAAAPGHRYQACCLIVDVQMPGIGGLGLQEVLNRDGVLVPLVFYSVVADIDVVVRAMKAGAVDFVSKTISWDRLVPRVERAIRMYNERAAAREAADEYHARLATLTPQETRVFELLVEGKSSKELGRALDIGTATVARHRAAVFRKLEAENVVELARQAWCFGIGPTPTLLPTHPGDGRRSPAVNHRAGISPASPRSSPAARTRP